MENPSVIVGYKSVYGSTRQYAEWIAAELGTQAVDLDAVREEELRACGTLVLGGCVRMGRIAAAPFLLRHRDILPGKRIALFSVSASPPSEPGTRKYFEDSVPEDLRAAVAFFPLWGRFGELNARDRFLMLFPKTLLRLRLLLRPDDAKARGTLKGMTSRFDHVDKAAIAPVVAYCRGGS